MNLTNLFTLAALLIASPGASDASAQEPADTNYDEAKVPEYVLPDPLRCFDGRAVTDAKTWREVRQPEILRAFATNIYGRTPEVATQLRFETTSVEPRALKGLVTHTPGWTAVSSRSRPAVGG